jgi:hypothetical protein
MNPDTHSSRPMLQSDPRCCSGSPMRPGVCKIFTFPTEVSSELDTRFFQKLCNLLKSLVFT